LWDGEIDRRMAQLDIKRQGKTGRRWKSTGGVTQVERRSWWGTGVFQCGYQNCWDGGRAAFL